MSGERLEPHRREAWVTVSQRKIKDRGRAIVFEVVVSVSGAVFYDVWRRLSALFFSLTGRLVSK